MRSTVEGDEGQGESGRKGECPQASSLHDAPGSLAMRELRKKPEGMQFRRQHPAGPYVLDFFCATSNLGIEVDGESHSRGDRPERDIARDWLRTLNIQVLRIPAIHVLKN